MPMDKLLSLSGDELEDVLDASMDPVEAALVDDLLIPIFRTCMDAIKSNGIGNTFDEVIAKALDVIPVEMRQAENSEIRKTFVTFMKALLVERQTMEDSQEEPPPGTCPATDIFFGVSAYYARMVETLVIFKGFGHIKRKELSETEYTLDVQGIGPPKTTSKHVAAFLCFLFRRAIARDERLQEMMNSLCTNERLAHIFSTDVKSRVVECLIDCIVIIFTDMFYSLGIISRDIVDKWETDNDLDNMDYKKVMDSASHTLIDEGHDGKGDQ
jgi:hypothetical protein